MTLSLHAALIPGWLQMLGAVEGLIGKAEAFVAGAGIDEEAFVQSRLAPDMLPLCYQLKSCWTHTALALQGARQGRFSPEMTPPPDRFDALRQMILNAQAACEQADEAELEALADKPVVFTIGDTFRLDFIARDFLLSFSQPNLYFHATTAYGIMRQQGVPIGKRDYLGALRIVQG